MKKRTTQLLSLMISAAMIASTPCLTYAAFQFRNTPVRFRRSGNMTSQIYSQTGALSDCKPAIFNGKATWYASNPLTAKTDGIITYATPFTVFRVKPGKLSAIQKIQPTPIKSQAPQPNTVSVHTTSQTVKKYTDLIHL